MRRVVITGVGVISPLGIGKDNFWEAVMAGKSSGKYIKDMHSSELMKQIEFKTKAIHEVESFDEDAMFKDYPFVKDLDRFIQFAVATADMAKKDSNIGNFPAERTGVIISSAIGGTKRMEEEYVSCTNYFKEPIDGSKIGDDLYLNSMANTPATIIAALNHLEGPCTTLSTGCIGGMDAIGLAFDAIRYGEADAMIAGASEAPLSPISISSFEVIHAVTSNDDCKKASKPFDANRNGFVLSEGCAMFVLEELESAKARGAKIYGEVKGFGTVANAEHMTDLVNNGYDLSRAIDLALEDAGMKPEEIDYVNAHGSSTKQNDRFETMAIKRSLGERSRQIPINSTKSMEGHPLASASAIEIAVCLQSFINEKVHQTINYSVPDEECDLDYVTEGSREWHGKTALKIASGFSGLHAAMIVQKYCGGNE